MWSRAREPATAGEPETRAVAFECGELTAGALGPAGGGVDPLEGDPAEVCCELLPDDCVVCDSTCAETETAPLVSAPAKVCTEAAGVETCAFTSVEPVGLVFVPAEVDATGVEALADVLVPLGVGLALACTEVAGAELLALADAAGGADCTLALAEAEAAGVLTLTVALAEGEGAVETDTPAGTETGVGGPVRPSAFAGAAKDRHQRTAATRIQKEQRKPGFRTMIVNSLVG